MSDYCGSKKNLTWLVLTSNAGIGISPMVDKKQVLFGTSSRAKIDHVRALMAGGPFSILSPDELGVDLYIIEDQPSAEEIACKKAVVYATAATMPAFAIDAGLTIDRFPPEKQPGIFVCRVHQDHVPLSDDELIRYYVAELDHIGGMSSGRWRVAVALALSADLVLSESYEVNTLFIAQVSPVRIPDAPLSSLMLDPATNRYYSEMKYTERPDSILLRKTLLSLFQNF
jgi:inosine/xanthosine triphosphate pyrophosphatase family protein